MVRADIARDADRLGRDLLHPCIVGGEETGHARPSSGPAVARPSTMTSA